MIKQHYWFEDAKGSDWNSSSENDLDLTEEDFVITENGFVLRKDHYEYIV